MSRHRLTRNWQSENALPSFVEVFGTNRKREKNMNKIKLTIFLLLNISGSLLAMSSLDESGEFQDDGNDHDGLIFPLSKSHSLQSLHDSSDDFFNDELSAESALIKLSSLTTSSEEGFVGVLAGSGTIFRRTAQLIASLHTSNNGDEWRASPTESEASIEDDPRCAYCAKSLLNTSFEYLNLNIEVCAECNTDDSDDQISEDETSLIEQDCSISFDSTEQQEFTDDEPLFNHKVANARSHKMSRFYRAKRSLLHKLHHTPKPLTRKQLKHLKSLQKPF